MYPGSLARVLMQVVPFYIYFFYLILALYAFKFSMVLHKISVAQINNNNNAHCEVTNHSPFLRSWEAGATNET